MDDDSKKFIKESYNEKLCNDIYKIICEELNEDGKIFKTNNGKKLIGYKFQDYINTNYDGLWPKVSIGSSKNNISVYVMEVEGEEYLVEKYGKSFGKSNVGKSCIRIKVLNETRINDLKFILSKI